jgi:CO dehydrogenase/acetyl-CoA synthase beta subunit
MEKIIGKERLLKRFEKNINRLFSSVAGGCSCIICHEYRASCVFLQSMGGTHIEITYPRMTKDNICEYCVEDLNLNEEVK